LTKWKVELLKKDSFLILENENSNPMNRILLFCLFALFFQTTQAQQATFSFNILGNDPEITAAAEKAGEIWGQYINSSIPIEVNIFTFALGPNEFLGLTIPNGVKDFPGAPQQDTWYPSCLANAITQTDLSPGEADMDIVLNISPNWYTGLDGNPPGNQYDLLSVILHEIGHGIGIASLGKIENGEGAFGTITVMDFSPLPSTTFPFPDLQGFPSTFDRFMVNEEEELLTDLNLYPSPSIALNDEFRGNALYFNGPLSIEANDGELPRLYAPNNYSFGSSLTHLDEATYPSGHPDALMTPSIGTGQVEHLPGPITLGMLKDLGWTISPTSVNDPPNKKKLPFLSVFPQPFFEKTNIQYEVPGKAPIRIYAINVLGQPVRELIDEEKPPGLHLVEWDGRDDAGAPLPSGIYFINLQWYDNQVSRPVILHR
jgi:hypothetical protein